MRLSLFVAALAAAGIQSALAGQSTSQVSMCVTTAIGTCGNFCQPFDCAPNYTLVSSNEVVRFDVAGAPTTAYVLFYGAAAPGCLPVPGIAGQLATWSPAAPIAFGSLSNFRTDLPCQPSTDQHLMKVPPVLPGIDLRFQVLGINHPLGTTTQHNPPVLSFSRPTEIRTR